MRNKKNRPFYCFVILYFIFGLNQTVSAQQRTISGKVTNVDRKPIPGASVIVKGTQKGTVTNNDGMYSIANVNESDTLIFSSLGMKTESVVAGTNPILNISLSQEAVQLGEVVAIGYGTVKKSDLTGSVSSVTSKEINSFPTTTPLLALSGRSAGVQVLQNNGSPGGSISVRIRGANSIQGSNEPLYVIDGFPSSSSNPSILNNSDIQSIEILKDASAVAIYGSRGANGVVLITTNKGKAGKTKVDYNFSIGYQSLRKKLKMMNAKEYATLYNEQATNDGSAPYFSADEIAKFGEGFNWQDLVFHTAPVQNHSLQVSGGNEKTQFSIDGSVFDQDGIIKKSNYTRYSISANINHVISKKFSINYSAILSKTKVANQNSSGARFGASLISAALLAPPTLTPYNDDGSYRVLATAYPFVSEGLTNPLNFINEISDQVRSNKILSNASIIFKPTQDLTIKVYGGIENTDDRSDFYKSLNYVNSQGNASVSANQFTSLLNENTITYNKEFNEKHKLSVLGGFTYQNFLSTSLSGSGTGFLSDATQTYNLASASLPGIPGSGYSKSVLLSYLGRINYSYYNRLLLTASFRADGSSKYSKNNKWGNFPSIALAWKLKEENFLKDNDFISDLKLRASWGVTGSQAIDAYATLNQLYSGKTVFGDALYTTISPSTVLPGDLKWETTAQKNIGADLGILQNRFRVTVDYYIKNTTDLLNSVQLPSSLGFLTTIQNVGEIRNQGFEVSADAHVINRKIRWNLNGNISFNNSKVLKLYNGQDILGGYVDMLVFADNVNLLREGEPVGVFFGYTEDGYTANGAIKYKDINNDGVINQQDKTIIGNPNPRFIYGLSSYISYKNIELDIFFQGSEGNDIANISSVDNALVYGYGDNLLEEVYNNHWTPANTNAKYPKITRNQSMNFSNRFIENGSYLRLRNIKLAYNIPFTSAVRPSWFNNLQIFVSGQNLITITGYSGWDPEVNSYGGANSISQGIDYYTYPTAKTVTFGLNVEF